MFFDPIIVYLVGGVQGGERVGVRAKSRVALRVKY